MQSDDEDDLHYYFDEWGNQFDCQPYKHKRIKDSSSADTTIDNSFNPTEFKVFQEQVVDSIIREDPIVSQPLNESFCLEKGKFFCFHRKEDKRSNTIALTPHNLKLWNQFLELHPDYLKSKKLESPSTSEVVPTEIRSSFPTLHKRQLPKAIRDLRQRQQTRSSDDKPEEKSPFNLFAFLRPRHQKKFTAFPSPSLLNNICRQKCNSFSKLHSSDESDISTPMIKKDSSSVSTPATTPTGSTSQRLSSSIGQVIQSHVSIKQTADLSMQRSPQGSSSISLNNDNSKSSTDQKINNIPVLLSQHYNNTSTTQASISPPPPPPAEIFSVPSCNSLMELFDGVDCKIQTNQALADTDNNGYQKSKKVTVPSLFDRLPQVRQYHHRAVSTPTTPHIPKFPYTFPNSPRRFSPHPAVRQSCCTRCRQDCNPWELCQPVRCIIDQNEVEILTTRRATHRRLGRSMHRQRRSSRASLE